MNSKKKICFDSFSFLFFFSNLSRAERQIWRIWESCEVAFVPDQSGPFFFARLSCAFIIYNSTVTRGVKKMILFIYCLWTGQFSLCRLLRTETRISAVDIDIRISHPIYSVFLSVLSQVSHNYFKYMYFLGK